VDFFWGVPFFRFMRNNIVHIQQYVKRLVPRAMQKGRWRRRVGRQRAEAGQAVVC
jgi:hypothetical protein